VVLYSLDTIFKRQTRSVYIDIVLMMPGYSAANEQYCRLARVSSLLVGLLGTILEETRFRTALLKKNTGKSARYAEVLDHNRRPTAEADRTSTRRLGTIHVQYYQSIAVMPYNA